MAITLTGNKFKDVAGNAASPNFLEAITSGYAEDNDCQPRLISQFYNYARVQDGTGEPDLVSVANALESAFSGEISPLLHTTFSGNAVRIRPMDDPEVIQDESDDPVDDGGDGAGDRLPLYAAVTVRGGVTIRSRSKTNKHYAPIPETHSQLDLLSDASLALWNAAISNFFGLISQITDANGNVWQLVMIQRSKSQVQTLPTSFTGCPVVSYEVNEILTTMRRRRKRNRVASCPPEEEA